MLGLASNTTTTSTSIDGGAHQQDGGGGAVEGERRASAGGGSRWHHQETMALLKIRSEMDAAFRDTCIKGPLWDEVSRKMMEHGYNRISKKCREKFENVLKYHKRTKEGGSSSKSGAKTYKFFDQLAPLENVTPPPSSQPPDQHLLPSSVAQMQVVHADPISVVIPPLPITATATPPPSQHSHHNQNNTASSSTSSDDDIEGMRKQKRKRKRKKKKKDKYYFMQVMMKNLIEKQEEFYKKLMETLEKQERERTIREEAWRNQVMERIRREYDLLAQEKLINQQNPKNPSNETNIITARSQPTSPPPLSPQQPPPPPSVEPLAMSPPQVMLALPVAAAPPIMSPPQVRNGQC